MANRDTIRTHLPRREQLLPNPATTYLRWRELYGVHLTDIIPYLLISLLPYLNGIPIEVRSTLRNIIDRLGRVWGSGTLVFEYVTNEEEPQTQPMVFY